MHFYNLTSLWNVSLTYFYLIFCFSEIFRQNLFPHQIYLFYFSFNCFYFLQQEVDVQYLFSNYLLKSHHLLLALAITLTQASFYLPFLVKDWQNQKVYDWGLVNNQHEFHLILFGLHVLFTFVVLISFFLFLIDRDRFQASKINLKIYRLIQLQIEYVENFFLNLKYASHLFV